MQQLSEPDHETLSLS